MKFHRNDSKDKVANYCKEVGVHFEYTNFWDKDEETFCNAKNMTALRKRFKKKIAIVGGKGKAKEKLKRKEEEEAKKREEEASRLVEKEGRRGDTEKAGRERGCQIRRCPKGKTTNRTRQ